MLLQHLFYKEKKVQMYIEVAENKINKYYNITSFFRFINKRASYPFGIISLAHGDTQMSAK
jgi:hypothetical protein